VDQRVPDPGDRALPGAGNAGREYGTLFCDEADGPLDPDRKRMFMDMKREVIRLGGYQREFFVSQTPELTAMARPNTRCWSAASGAGTGKWRARTAFAPRLGASRMSSGKQGATASSTDDAP
jgi:hypothetical protein